LKETHPGFKGGKGERVTAGRLADARSKREGERKLGVFTDLEKSECGPPKTPPAEKKDLVTFSA